MNSILLLGNEMLLFSELLKRTIDYSSKFKSFDVKIVDHEELYNSAGAESVVIIPIWDDQFDKFILQLDQTLSDEISLLLIDFNKSRVETICNLISVNRKIGIVNPYISVDEFEHYLIEFLNSDRKWILSNDIQQHVIDYLFSYQGKKSLSGTTLTSTEQQIINLAKQGYSISQMADRLHLSPNTIAVYRSRILKKSGKKTMTQLLANSY
ncbi:MAG: helix-turn-helix transcriptional regulator [Taibaiella sp.]|nr:helix-turn-helix transcriptional regulator [Taibaiella sp.]MBX9449327.1 helix-turn-helix transcriptional regulator [Taibaiella sp.]